MHYSNDVPNPGKKNLDATLLNEIEPPNDCCVSITLRANRNVMELMTVSMTTCDHHENHDDARNTFDVR